MLLLGFFMCFAFLMVAGLAVDVGHIYLSHQKMQVAADAAVVEVLRGLGSTSSEDSRREVAGRHRAQVLVRQIFCDHSQIGSGPGGELTCDTGDSMEEFRAAEKGDLQLHRPALALNLDNASNGDIVVGTFDTTATRHSEQPNYGRSDFFPEASHPTAALVRLRRTDEVFSSGVSQAGQPVPALFGRMSLMVAPGESDSLLSRGVIVRATAIARLTPAVSAGQSVEDAGTPAVIGLQTPGLALPLNDVGEIDMTSPRLYERPTGGFLSIGEALPMAASGSAVGGIQIAAVTDQRCQDCICGFVVVHVDSAVSPPNVTFSEPPVGCFINASSVFQSASMDPVLLSSVLTWHQSVDADPASTGHRLLKVPARVRVY